MGKDYGVLGSPRVSSIRDFNPSEGPPCGCLIAIGLVVVLAVCLVLWFWVF